MCKIVSLVCVTLSLAVLANPPVIEYFADCSGVVKRGGVFSEGPILWKAERKCALKIYSEKEQVLSGVCSLDNHGTVMVDASYYLKKNSFAFLGRISTGQLKHKVLGEGRVETLAIPNSGVPLKLSIQQWSANDDFYTLDISCTLVTAVSTASDE